ncbi:hypothetical protein CCZ01_00435 [Helicobacter monodelphidis]|uniref:hypothetical protein n=1 Tax=Helicobacter sp. 15-1451 TaxID=2004995 RepID=UPI000DCB4EE1|nr:hypothetical protein [Helicobacter sp. 15-1451]RAX59247.1 hypothetical protein CCZ01_00435 [Helicobacter sp. 15-1451]
MSINFTPLYNKNPIVVVNPLQSGADKVLNQQTEQVNSGHNFVDYLYEALQGKDKAQQPVNVNDAKAMQIGQIFGALTQELDTLRANRMRENGATQEIIAMAQEQRMQDAKASPEARNYDSFFSTLNDALLALSGGQQTALTKGLENVSGNFSHVKPKGEHALNSLFADSADIKKALKSYNASMPKNGTQQESLIQTFEA